MPYTTLARNLMLDALAALATKAALFTEQSAITSVTGTASSDTFNKNSHGLANGDLVVLRSKTGGTGIYEEQPYFVINQAANTFQLSRLRGGSAINFTTDISGVSVVELTEVTGGSPAYTRESIAWNAAADAQIDDSTDGAAFDVPACTITYVGFYADTTDDDLYQLSKLASAETFTAQGVFTLTDAKLNLRASKADGDAGDGY